MNRHYLIILALLFFYFFLPLIPCSIPEVFAQEPPRSKKFQEPEGDKKKVFARAKEEREPFEVSPEFQKEQGAEMPKIVVRGVMKRKGKTAAIAEMDLKYKKGISLLEVGDRFSTEKKGAQDSGRSSTYFTIKSISRAGICIELENGEEIWYPVMGKD